MTRLSPGASRTVRRRQRSGAAGQLVARLARAQHSGRERLSASCRRQLSGHRRPRDRRGWRADGVAARRLVPLSAPSCRREPPERDRSAAGCAGRSPPSASSRRAARITGVSGHRRRAAGRDFLATALGVGGICGVVHAAGVRDQTILELMPGPRRGLPRQGPGRLAAPPPPRPPSLFVPSRRPPPCSAGRPGQLRAANGFPTPWPTTGTPRATGTGDQLGPLGGGRLAAEGAQRGQRLAARGWAASSRSRAGDLEQLLRGAPPQVGVLPIRWVSSSRRCRRHAPPLLADIAREHEETVEVDDVAAASMEDPRHAACRAASADRRDHSRPWSPSSGQRGGVAGRAAGRARPPDTLALTRCWPSSQRRVETELGVIVPTVKLLEGQHRRARACCARRWSATTRPGAGRGRRGGRLACWSRRSGRRREAVPLHAPGCLDALLRPARPRPRRGPAVLALQPRSWTATAPRGGVAVERHWGDRRRLRRAVRGLPSRSYHLGGWSLGRLASSPPSGWRRR
jgi:hypothetical protein